MENASRAAVAMLRDNVAGRCRSGEITRRFSEKIFTVLNPILSPMRIHLQAGHEKPRDYYRRLTIFWSKFMIVKKLAVSLMAVSASLTAGMAQAGSADSAIDACVTAVGERGAMVVDGNVAKIKSRGASWEVWLNVDTNDSDLKVWCYSTRGKVKELVTQQGVWLGRNVRRPESDLRLAQARTSNERL
jgi:hypothetical protein